MKKFLLAAFWGAFICGTLFAEVNVPDHEPLRITPNEAVEMAIRNNLSLQSARIATETRRRASNLSWNQFIPNVTVAGSLMVDNEASTQGSVTAPIFSPTAVLTPMNVGGVSGNFIGAGDLTGFFITNPVDLPRWRIVVPIQASLTLNLAMFENMNRLRIDYESGLIAYERARAQLERDIRKAYNNMLFLQENVSLLQESFITAQRRVDMARANFQAGLAPELTLLQAQVAMENMKPIIDQVKNGLQLSMAQFAMFLGLPIGTPFELVPVDTDIPFISLDMQNLISRAASGRPDIQELRQNILLLHSARRMQANALLPSLSLSWNFNSIFMRDPVNDGWMDTIRDGALTIGLGVRLHSLFPFSTDSQAVRNMDDQIRMANIGLAQMIQGTEIEIFNTVLSLDRIRITADAQSQTVDLAERAFRLTEDAYRAGLLDLLQVQNAELELRQARVSMLEQQFNYLNGLIDLEYAIGVPFGTLSAGGE